jgi:hypothetical protein
LPDSLTYDLTLDQRIAAIKSIAKKQEDGLRLLRLLSPDMHPDYNDQVGVAKCRAVEQAILETNRGSKSMTSAAKIAAVARDVPLIAWDGEEIECRPDHQKGKNLTIWIIGLQLNHIGQTMFRLLFEEGAFQVIQDEDTGAWRTWKPWEEYDRKYSHMARPGPAFIPSYEIDHDSWVWEHKGAKQVSSVRLKNGTQFHFYPSTGEVKKGDPVHVIWIDELVANSEHYPEWIARLTDYEGWLLWSTMIYRGCEAISLLMDAAEEQRQEVDRGDRKEATTVAFNYKPKGNPYLSAKRLDINREIYERFGSDIVKQRLDGGDIYDSTLIYPFFDKMVHTAIPDDRDEWDDLSHVLHDLNGLPPADWTHEMAIDPGAQKPAVLFFATPPPRWTDASGKEWELWGSGRPFHVPYDEIYGQRYSLNELVRQIKLKLRDIRFRRFIMDMQGGRISSMTGGPPAHRQFSKAFAEENIESEETGTGFRAGGTEFEDRKLILDQWMQIQKCGKPQLRIVTQRCPNLCAQLSRNRYALDGTNPIPKPAKREKNDMRVSLEYIASRNPTYVKIDQTPIIPRALKEAMDRRDAIFGTTKKPQRCHFGPGEAPA